MLRIAHRAVVLALFSIILGVISCDDVIIIGAGAAGIAAATKLLENNVSNITILEAEDRIGGRIYSVQFGERIVDLGGQWCHGEEDNIVYELVKDMNLLEPLEVLYNYYYSSQEKFDHSFVKELRELFYNIYYHNEYEGELSLGEYLIKRYNETITSEYGSSPDKISFAWEFLNTLMKGVLSIDGAFSWFDVSAQSDYKVCKGNLILSWKGRGYKTILDVLMRKHLNPDDQLAIDDKILLNKEVIEIVWDSNPADPKKATVKCLDGTVYNADKIIFTPSLGVLKERHATLFKPALPEEKINAIRDLGIGAVAKVFLHFPEQWWPQENFTDCSFIWGEKDQHVLLQEFSEGPNENGKSWLTNLVGLFVVAESPQVLAAWFAGEFVPEIELCSDELLTEGIMFALNKFVGHQFNVTKPDSVKRNNWYANPHFRGTYSYQTVQSRKGNLSGEVVLSQPLVSKNGKAIVLFAGEATHPHYYSTVHGAIETGHREAGRIIKSLLSV